MWDRIIDSALRNIIVDGRLEVGFPDGSRRVYGQGGSPSARITIHDMATCRKLVMGPDLALGEAYVDQRLTIEDDDLHGLLAVLLGNRGRGKSHWVVDLNLLLQRLGRRLAQYNPAPRAQQNVAHHYDLSGDLYDLFLDADKQYSCAYFKDPGDSLETAQAQKKAHIADKLLIEPGMRVLDIGCGWGGMALTLARDYGAQVLGVTLSYEQFKVATARAHELGLQERVQFRLMDYRKVTEKFDRIVSVGMFEHVGVPHYREYFRHIKSKLTEDGIAVIHTIGRSSPPGSTSPWIQKYIFPGGYCPAMSETMAAIEKEALCTTDVEVWRLHYAETLLHWLRRFEDNIDAARALYDDRFCRMWRFYLVSSEMTFRLNHQVVFQFQLAPEQANVPLTRDYLYPAEITRDTEIIPRKQLPMNTPPAAKSAGRKTASRARPRSSRS